MAQALKTFFVGGFGAVTPIGDLGLFLARVSIGLMMAIGHGFSKIWQDGHFGPPQMMVDGIAQMGLPLPIVMAWLAAIAEFAGAILLALGLFTRPVALMLVINMAVAAFVAHGKDPWFMGQGPSKEPALLYLIPFALFLFTGAGRFSIDALIRTNRPPRGFPVK
jgi:putative oxidoreductase